MNKTTLLGFGSSLVNKSFISELLQVGLGAGGMMIINMAESENEFENKYSSSLYLVVDY